MLVRDLHGEDAVWETEAAFEEECDTWEEQVRYNTEGLHALELVLPEPLAEEQRWNFVGSISQDEQMSENSQVPYAEVWLDPGGTHEESAASCRLACFLHFMDVAMPLFVTWNEKRHRLTLPEPGSLPQRLAALMHYDLLG